jgi:6-phosphogluconolactonase
MRAGSALWASVAIAMSLFASPLRAQFAYVANNASNDVSGYTINASTGALTPMAGSPFAAGLGPASVAVDPSGKFTYVVNNVSKNVSGYTIDPSTGELTSVGSFPAGLLPFSMAVDPSGKFAYVANAGEITADSNVSGYKINSSTGALTAIPGSPFPAGRLLFSVAVDPSGKFAYVANAFFSNVSGYTIDQSTGALTPIAGSPFAAGSFPVSVAMDPTGKFAYVANSGDNNVSGYTINQSTGALTPIAGSPFAAGTGPFSVTVDPSGKFVYVANLSPSSLRGTVSGYTIDPSTGALTDIGNFRAGLLPISVAVDPSGTLAYVVNNGSNSVSGYTINQSTGVLKAIGSFPTGSGPFSVAISPVPFASSSAKLEITAGPPSSFDLNESFTLAKTSRKINPLTENVTLRIGTFSVTIPAGSFIKDPNGEFAFQGGIKGVSLRLKIVPLGNKSFTFKAEGTGANLTGLTNPVTVVLTIGINSGATTVTAKFQ